MSSRHKAASRASCRWVGLPPAAAPRRRHRPLGVSRRRRRPPCSPQWQGPGCLHPGGGSAEKWACGEGGERGPVQSPGTRGAGHLQISVTALALAIGRAGLIPHITNEHAFGGTGGRGRISRGGSPRRRPTRGSRPYRIHVPQAAPKIPMRPDAPCQNRHCCDEQNRCVVLYMYYDPCCLFDDATRHES
jgi:hypothetical protein